MDMKDQGKIRFIGLSEPSPETLEKALNFCPIAAVQSELSSVDKAAKRRRLRSL